MVNGISKNASPKSGNDLGWVIWETFQNLHKSFDEALRPYGLTGTQLSLLIRIAEEPGLSGAELARRTLTTTQAANLALKALERKGLIERTSIDGGGNILQATVTDAGHAAMQAGYEVVQDIGQRRQKNLTKADREQLRTLLHKYASDPG